MHMEDLKIKHKISQKIINKVNPKKVYQISLKISYRYRKIVQMSKKSKCS